MARQNFYETLGLQKGASAKEIKSAYYQLAIAKKWHPDVNKGNADAEKKFQEIQQAYEVLKDDEKRAMYDQMISLFLFYLLASGGLVLFAFWYLKLQEMLLVEVPLVEVMVEMNCSKALTPFAKYLFSGGFGSCTLAPLI